jgi:hypothetical protein
MKTSASPGERESHIAFRRINDMRNTIATSGILAARLGDHSAHAAPNRQTSGTFWARNQCSSGRALGQSAAIPREFKHLAKAIERNDAAWGAAVGRKLPNKPPVKRQICR